MRVAILNGSPDGDNVKFDDYLKNLSDLLKSNNYKVTVSRLREMDYYRISSRLCLVDKLPHLY